MYNMYIRPYDTQCVSRDNEIFKHGTIFGFGIGFDTFWVSYFLRCFGLVRLSQNWFFKSCFQQGAKCKMTAHTMREHHILIKSCTLLDLLLKPRFHPPSLCSLYLVNSFCRRYVSSVHCRWNRSDTSKNMALNYKLLCVIVIYFVLLRFIFLLFHDASKYFLLFQATSNYFL